MLIKCESQENAYSDRMGFLFLPLLGKTLIRKDKILETIGKKECFLCRKDIMRKDLDIGVLWSHEGVLNVNQHSVDPENASNHLSMYN